MQSDAVKTILLVEDQAIIAMSEADILKKNGFDVIISSTGENAVEKFKDRNSINLVLMDIDLGKGIDGTEAARRILKMQEVPIVFLSNHTEKEIVDKTEQITSYGYVVKNSGETVLIASIKMAFKLFEAHCQILESKEKLIESDNKFQTLEKQIDDVIWTMDMNFRFTYISPSVGKMHGYSADEMMQLNPQDYLTPESQEVIFNILAEEINNFISNKSESRLITITLDQVKKDGTVFPTEIKTRFLLDSQKNPIGIIGVTRDVSERQKSREALLESKRALDLALEGAQIGFWDSNYQTGKVYRSDIWASMLGYTIDEVDNTSEFWQNHIHPDDLERVLTEVKKHEAGNVEHFSVEHRMRTKSGMYKWILDWGKVFERTESGRPIRAMGVHIDIDDRIKAQQRLIETNKTLNLALEGAQIGLWNQNFETGEVVRSEYWAKMLGYEPSEIENQLGFWKSLIHPDDYEMTIKIAEEHEEGKTEFYKVQHRLKCKDGSYKWILNWGKISERDKTGKPLKANGIHLDIDDRVKSEEYLTESEEKYRRFFEEDLSGVFISTPSGKLKACNWAYARMMEYDSVEEMLSTNAVEHYENSQDRVDFLNLLREKRKLIDYEGDLKSKKGKHIYTLENIIGIFNDNNELVEFWGYVNDITDRKKAEIILKNAADEKEALHRELLHRVKNSFALIKSLIYLERERQKDNFASDILEDLEHRVGSLSEMYSILNYTGTSGEINLGHYLKQIVQALSESFVINDKRINIETSFDDLNVAPKEASSIGLIVNEILTNSFKYAFRGKPSGNLSVILKKENETATITISDDGIGLPKDFDIKQSTGMGLELTKLLTKQLSGTLNIESTKGTLFRIVIPINCL
jgi:PAS domain S-box-containing protein